MAQKLNARLRLLPVPGIISSRAAAQALISDPQISETLALAARADIGIVGLGVLVPDAVILRSGTIINQSDLALLKQAGAVGDVGLRFMDAHGRPLQIEIDRRIIGLTLDQIASIPRVIGVGGGEAKVQVIRAALRARILDILVTDHATAQALREDPD
jgi:DNA-binding transcriptional regulator LsrR (DeoR family)